MRKGFAAGALFALALSLLIAATYPDGHTAAFPGTTTTETPSSASPITVTSNSVAILPANSLRNGACIQSQGTGAVQCCLAATCTTTVYDFSLNAPATADTGGSSWCTGNGGVVWRGAVTCAGAAGKVSVYGVQ